MSRSSKVDGSRLCTSALCFAQADSKRSSDKTVGEVTRASNSRSRAASRSMLFARCRYRYVDIPAMRDRAARLKFELRSSTAKTRRVRSCMSSCRFKSDANPCRSTSAISPMSSLRFSRSLYTSFNNEKGRRSERTAKVEDHMNVPARDVRYDIYTVA